MWLTLTSAPQSIDLNGVNTAGVKQKEKTRERKKKIEKSERTHTHKLMTRSKHENVQM